MVRAKMQCRAIETVLAYSGDASKPAATQEVVKLSAVYGEENKPWSQYTPQGEVSMHITNPDAVKRFEVGGFYYVDFTPAT